MGKRGTLAMIAAACALCATSTGGSAGQPTSRGTAQLKDPFSGLPARVTLSAWTRTFKAGEHPDFAQRRGLVRTGLVHERLGPDALPRLLSSVGRSLSTPFKDASGRGIAPHLYQPALSANTKERTGDTAGLFQAVPDTEPLRSIDSAQTFSTWFDTSLARERQVTFLRGAWSNQYVYDSRTQFGAKDTTLSSTRLVGAVEVRKGLNQTMTFTSAGDLWVFVGGRLVVDLGGSHAQASQTVAFDRLAWLPSGRHEIQVFHAGRTGEPHWFRVETSAMPMGRDDGMMANVQANVVPAGQP